MSSVYEFFTRNPALLAALMFSLPSLAAAYAWYWGKSSGAREDVVKQYLITCTVSFGALVGFSIVGFFMLN